MTAVVLNRTHREAQWIMFRRLAGLGSLKMAQAQDDQRLIGRVSGRSKKAHCDFSADVKANTNNQR